MSIEGQSDCTNRAQIISLVSNLAKRIAEESRDELRRLIFAAPPMTYGEIARSLFPDQCERAFEVTRNAVTTAAKLILTAAEQQSVCDRNANIGYERHIETCGSTRWSSGEIHELKRLLTAEVYPPGHVYAGSPCYGKIAKTLNAMFHDQQDIRTGSSCRTYVIATQKKNSFLFQTQSPVLSFTPWITDECDRLKKLVQDPEHQYSVGSKVGAPDWKKIAATLNREFHSAALREGVNIRGSVICRTRYWKRLHAPHRLTTE